MGWAGMVDCGGVTRASTGAGNLGSVGTSSDLGLVQFLSINLLALSRSFVRSLAQLVVSRLATPTRILLPGMLGLNLRRWLRLGSIGRLLNQFFLSLPALINVVARLLTMTTNFDWEGSGGTVISLAQSAVQISEGILEGIHILSRLLQILHFSQVLGIGMFLQLGQCQVHQIGRGEGGSPSFSLLLCSEKSGNETRSSFTLPAGE